MLQFLSRLLGLTEIPEIETSCQVLTSIVLPTTDADGVVPVELSGMKGWDVHNEIEWSSVFGSTRFRAYF